MDFAEYFGDNLRAAPEPEPEYETYEQWAWRLISEERRTIERLVRESLRDRPAAVDAPAVPAMPDAMVSNESTRAAWSIFHSPGNSRARPLREANPTPVRRRPRARPMYTLVEDQRFDHLRAET